MQHLHLFDGWSHINGWFSKSLENVSAKMLINHLILIHKHFVNDCLAMEANQAFN